MVYLKYNTVEEIKKIKEIEKLKNEIEKRGGSVINLYYDSEVVLNIFDIEADLKKCYRTLKLLNETEVGLNVARRIL